MIDVVTAGLSIGPPVSIAQYDGLLTDAPIEIRLYITRVLGAAVGASSVSGSLSGAGRATAAAGTSTVSGTLSGGGVARATAAGAATARDGTLTA